MSAPKAPAPSLAAGPAGRAWFRAYIWAFLALFVIYPLSIGPICRFTKTREEAKAMVETAYGPVLFLCDHCDPVGRFFRWYVVDFWKVAHGN